MIILFTILVVSTFLIAYRLDRLQNIGRVQPPTVGDSVLGEPDLLSVGNGGAVTTAAGWGLVQRDDEVNLLAHLIAGEATGEPYAGKVAVGAVMLNRVRSAQFPNTIGGVIYQPHAFESVSNGLIWRVSAADLTSARKAAIDALNGWDPTYGCLFFWNPYKPVSSWIWSRQISTQIGNHVFAR
jgi:N-acetylmuramoyl-L-alanine amidase